MRNHGVHRWTVDGIEEDSARVEEDGARMITVPLYLLPSAVHIFRGESSPDDTDPFIRLGAAGYARDS